MSNNLRRLKVKVLSILMIALLLFSTNAVFAADTGSAAEATKEKIETTDTLDDTTMPPKPDGAELTNNNEEPAVEIPAPDNLVATTDTDITIDNEADLNNDTELDLNTGRNDVGNNTIITGLETGDIDGTVNLINLGNTILGDGSTFSSQNLLGGNQDIVLFDPDPAHRIDISGANIGTGVGSGNTNIFENNNIVHIFEQTSSNADNVIDIIANTGENEVMNNTEIDNIATGDINLGVNLINLLNVIAPNLELTVDVWNILGDFSGDIILANTDTGVGSNNSNGYYGYGATDIDIQNNSDATNYFDLGMNTGENDFGQNTMVGDVNSGSASSLSNVSTISNINTPMYYLLNVFGEWDGNYGGLDPRYTIVNVINEATGAGSDNLNIVGDNSFTDIDIDNDASANNNINISANTGRNQIQRNTIVGGISTGNINVAQNVINILNSFDHNLSRFRLGIINIFGSWRHNSAVVDEGGSTPVISETPAIPNNVLGVQRANPEMRLLPQAGADLPNATDISLGVQPESPARTPIWGLLALLCISLTTLLNLGYKTKKTR